MGYSSKYSGAQVEAYIDQIANGDIGGGGSSIIDHGVDDTTFTLTPNVIHRWGTISSLSLTLTPATDNSKASYYMAEFMSGSTPTTLSIPDTIKWSGDVMIEANKTYQLSILNNCGIIVGF